VLEGLGALKQQVDAGRQAADAAELEGLVLERYLGLNVQSE